MNRLLVIGIVMATALTACNRQPQKQIGAAAASDRKLPVAAATVAPIAQVGRYIVVRNLRVEHETMLLLDTATGKTWQLAEFPDLKGSPMGWENVPRLDTLQDWESFVAGHRKAERGDDKRSAFLPESH